jgi:hypothetical protein
LSLLMPWLTKTTATIQNAGMTTHHSINCIQSKIIWLGHCQEQMP